MQNMDGYRLPAGITNPNKNTIWTDRVSAVINFLQTLTSSANVVSRFQSWLSIIGDISNIATKYFMLNLTNDVLHDFKGTFEKEENVA